MGTDREAPGKKRAMFLKVGHRGAAAYATENTLKSFEKAIALGANAVELDVRKSGDRKLVISHDDNLKRVYGKEVNVGGSTFEELREATGGRMTSLEEALGFIDGRVEKIFLELKETGDEKDVLSLIRKAGMEENVVLISFHEEALAALRIFDRRIETGLIYSKAKKPVETALNLGAQYLLPLYRFVHRKDVEKAHANNLKVVVWTINTQGEAREYVAKGVDGIASDRPDIFGDIIK